MLLSGLMIGNMKSVIEMYVPIVNRINPAANFRPILLPEYL